MGFPSYETVKSGCYQVQGRFSYGYQLTGRKAPRADTSCKAWLPPRLAPPWLDPRLWPKPNIAMLPRELAVSVETSPSSLSTRYTPKPLDGVGSMRMP